MPLIDVRLLEGVFSRDERQQLAEGLIDAVVAVKGESFRTETEVLIAEVPVGNWYERGSLISPESVGAETHQAGFSACRASSYSLAAMSDREEFLAWVTTTLYEAELALHNGDAAPRRALQSRKEPVSVLGAWRNAHGRGELDELFAALGRSFSDCTSFRFELLAYDVVGDMAHTAGFEHTSASVDGQARTYTLRATQVYRREDGAWKVAHRHGDTVTE